MKSSGEEKALGYERGQKTSQGSGQKSLNILTNPVPQSILELSKFWLPPQVWWKLIPLSGTPEGEALPDKPKFDVLHNDVLPSLPTGLAQDVSLVFRFPLQPDPVDTDECMIYNKLIHC